MNNPKQLLSILQTQAAIGRTSEGWDLGKGMPEVSSESLAKAKSDQFVGKQCLNCKFVASGEYFMAGCPNCGSKDHNSVTTN